MNRENLISLIYAVENSENNSFDFLKKSHQYLSEKFDDFEIVVVTGTKNKSVEKLLQEIDSTRALYLSGELDIQTAYSAGLNTAIGDYMILADNDVLVETIEQALNLVSSEDHDLVIGISTQKKSLFYRLFRQLYFSLFQGVLPEHPPKNASNFRLLSRNLVQLLLKKQVNPKKLFVSLSQMQFSSCTFLHKGSPHSQNSLWKGARQGISLMIYGSTKPLRFVSALGLLGSFLGIVISVYAIIVHIFKENNIEGWTSLTLFFSIQFFLIFIILVFIGEYLARSIEQKESSLSDKILFEKNSTKIKLIDRKNIHSNKES